MAIELTTLTADVTQTTTVPQATANLLANITAQLRTALAALAASDYDGARDHIQALEDQLTTNEAAIGAAVNANTTGENAPLLDRSIREGLVLLKEFFAAIVVPPAR